MSGIRNQSHRTTPEGCVPTTSPQAILSRIHEARRLSDTARWALLDVTIRLNEIEDAIVRSSKAALRAALDDLDLTGLGANRLDSAAREYRPDSEPDWCP